MRQTSRRVGRLAASVLLERRYLFFRFGVIRILYSSGSQSAPYGAPGLRERNLGAPRAIRLVFFLFYCGAP